MKHLVWLVVILGVSANAETFRMVRADESERNLLNCREKVGEYSWKEWTTCTDQDGYENLWNTLTFEVSCSSKNITFAIPTTSEFFSRSSQYEIDNRIMSYEELSTRLSSDYSKGTNYVSKRPVIQRNPVDIWFYGGRHQTLNGLGCGGYTVSQGESGYCDQVRTSGSLVWSKIDSYENESLPIVRFSVSRDSLWEFLRQRQEFSDTYDRGYGRYPENEFLELRLWVVDNPNVRLIKLGDRVGRRSTRTNTHAKVWRMYGKAKLFDGFHLPTDIDWVNIPKEISEELNRLQDYYNSCQVPQVAPAPPPAQERPALDYSAINAKEYLKIMKIVDSVWDDYKDMTLEEYVNLP